MTAFYDQKDLEEELSGVGCGDEDLDFDYLFEYGQPCGDVAGASQGLSDAFWSPCGASAEPEPDSGGTRLIKKLHLITDLKQEVIYHVVDVHGNSSRFQGCTGVIENIHTSHLFRSNLLCGGAWVTVLRPFSPCR